MKFYFTVAWRNIWRNARRSLITAFAMAISVSLCMALIVINDGFYTVFFDVMVTQQLGHVQVQNPEYIKTKSMYESLDDSSKLMEMIRKDENTKTLTGRLYGNGLVSAGEKSSGAQITGINPVDEKQVTSLFGQIEKGTYLSEAAKKEVIVGIDVFEDLSLDIGGEIFILSQGIDGSPVYDIYTVVGMYKSGSVIKDKGMQMHVQDLQQLLLMEDQLHEIVVLTSSEEMIPKLSDSLKKTLVPTEEKKAKVGVKTWWETSPQTSEMMGFRDVGSFIFLGIVFFIAGFGILNTMLMSVFERTRELGVIKALGLRPLKMVLLIVVESVFLSGIAAFMGLVLGAFFSYLLVEYGIDMSGGTGDPLKMLGASLDPQMKGVVKLDFLMLPVIFLFVISVIASLWPAIRAARLNPIEAIRSE
jgi:putative ABC transport system permease protein